jgi:hypothetical protein
MLIRNNDGEVVGDQDGRPVAQNITVRDDQGSVRTTNVIGGKLLP